MIKKKCTVRTFWIGFKDWLRDGSAKSLPEESRQLAKDTWGFAKPALTLTLIVLVVLLSFVFLQYANSHMLFKQAPTNIIRASVAILANLMGAAFLAHLGWSFLRKWMIFSGEMCARGHAILELS